jgi:hypothetical protein
MKLTAAADQVIDQLTAMPSAAKPTLKRNDLQSLLLYSDGWLTIAGHQYDIRSKHIGAGVYQVWVDLRT